MSIIIVNRWLIAQLAGMLLSGVRRRYLAAPFPRRHELRKRWFNLLDKADLRPYVVADVIGESIYLGDVAK